MAKAKKLINDPERIAEAAIGGMIDASDGRLVHVPVTNAVMRSSVPEGKVALPIGGGSRHEPMDSAYVGERFADASVCDNIFSAASSMIANIGRARMVGERALGRPDPSALSVGFVFAGRARILAAMLPKQQ